MKTYLKNMILYIINIQLKNLLLSHTFYVFTIIIILLDKSINIFLVRKLFSNPIKLANSNFLRREIAKRMLEHLTPIKMQPKCILDAGCGEGADILMLKKRYLNAYVVGIDGSYNMLTLAKKHYTKTQFMSNFVFYFFYYFLFKTHNVLRYTNNLICTNFAQLPLASNTLDIIWSNLALHWHPQPNTVFLEWKRVLRTQGLLVFSCFGPDTFKEVRFAFNSIDTAGHILPFIDMHDFGDMLINAGFSSPVIDMEMFTLKYNTPQDLLMDLRAWGGNPLENRRRSLLGINHYQSIVSRLEKMRDINYKIPLSFEIIYGHAFQHSSKNNTNNERIIHFHNR